MTEQLARPILEVKDLTMAFGGLVAFQGVSLTIQPGQIVGLIGPNGAGKTTLLNCITGVYRPTAGEIFFQGRSLLRKPPHQICRQGIGRTFQIPRPFMYMSVLENLQVCSRREDAWLERLLEMVGLKDKRGHLAKKLTFQERRLLELARALAVEPRLLLLDETVAGLNPTETVQMMSLLRQIHGEFGLTILWIEHVMKAIMENAHQVICLHQGSLIARGTPAEIARNPKVVEAYLGEEYRFEKGGGHA